MIDRCHNPNSASYQRYGGRGITVCDEWRFDFQAFCRWAREHRHDPHVAPSECTIDRINNNKGYSPDNCRWVNMKAQQRNRRTNRIIEFGGRKMTLVEWAEFIGMRPGTLLKRLDSGWSVKDAIMKPLAENKRHPKT